MTTASRSLLLNSPPALELSLQLLNQPILIVQAELACGDRLGLAAEGGEGLLELGSLRPEGTVSSGPVWIVQFLSTVLTSFETLTLAWRPSGSFIGLAEARVES